MPAGQVQVVLSVNKATYSAAMADAQRQLDTFAGKARGAGHSTITSMQSASAAIRLLDNPMGANIRALERFATQSQLVGKIFAAAFPIVGLISAGRLLFSLGDEVAKFVEQVRKMPAVIDAGFNSLHLSAASSTDALRLTNDELANSIAKLQGRPQNGLAIVLDEARVKADALAKSLEDDNTKIKQLLEQSKVSGWSVLIGSAGTASVSGSVTSYSDQLADLGRRRADAVRSGNTDTADDLGRQITAKQQSALDWTKHQTFVRQNPGMVGEENVGNLAGDQSSNLSILRGFRQSIVDRQDAQAAQETNGKLVAQQKSLQAAKEYQESLKKAAAEQLQQMEQANSDWKAAEDRTLLEDANWWKARQETLTRGSDNYKAIQKKINQDVIEQNRQDASALAKFTTEYLNDFNKSSGVSGTDQESIKVQGSSALQYVQALRESIELQKQNASAIAESSLEMAVATGQMTRLDAAQVAANLHTQEYNAALKELKDQRDAISSSPEFSNDPTGRAAALQKNQNQIDSLNANRQIQAQHDNAAVNPQGSLGSVGFRDALDEFVTASRDAATQMRDLTQNVLGSLNENITSAMTGGRTNWAGTFQGIGKNIAGVGLNRLEGSILGGLGFGKPSQLGTKDNPIYTRPADLASTVASVASPASWLGRFIGGQNNDDHSGSGIGSVFSSVIGSLPGFANGGAISANSLSIIGERGPELFSPSVSGRVIPNNQLSQLGGGDTHHWNIDARGSSDPAAVEVAVQRGIAAARPGIVAQSVAANRDYGRRTPQTRRF
ncbi:MAG TPA: phage tail tape measure C-terminal domain-containing protein [Edaphobacter sp.]|nr:phage tail tape measure C-terminal domain-containing protein [Edaphobacter sp.]